MNYESKSMLLICKKENGGMEERRLCIKVHVVASCGDSTALNIVYNAGNAVLVAVSGRQ